ncbi:MAG: exo-alpha-sialidase [Candidatus Hydrogenedentes bacterium]|nr:exo-alpha-sialidase [Candidatus Hydrogenedentota bacterium]
MRCVVACGAFAASLLFASPHAFAGLGFSDPIAIEKGANNDTNPDSGPRLEWGNGVWIASWHKGDLAVETDVVISRSVDNGATWSEPVALNDNADTDSVPDYSIRTATDGAGNWVAIWVIDLGFASNIANSSIMVSHSSDDGATWSDPEVLSTKADIYSTFALLFAAGTPLPWLSTDAQGNWLAAWRCSVPTDASGDIDILCSHSEDNGETWSSPAPVSPAGDTVNDSGPRLVSIGTGRWMIMWNYADFLVADGLLVARSNNNGESWGLPTTLQNYGASDTVRRAIQRLDSDGDGTWIGIGDVTDWDLSGSIPLPTTDSDIFLIRSEDNGRTWTEPVVVNSNASNPALNDGIGSLTTDKQGNWMLAWTTGNTQIPDPDTDLSACFSTDNGVTWTSRVTINSNARKDGGDDAFTGVKTDGLGNWVVTWSSNNILPGNTDNEDTDIHATTSTLTTGDNLFVLSPDGGEQWETGKRRAIEWLSVGNVGKRVNINLLRNDQLVAELKDRVLNDGLFKWRIPAETEPGAKYSVQVISRDNPAISDTSDGRFRIVLP